MLIKPLYEIELDSGLLIHLRNLNQRGTYDGLLEGIFSARLSNMLLKMALERVRKPSLLIEPVRHPFQLPENLRRSGPGERLPEVECSAMFLSTWIPGRGADQTYLNILWYQDQWALPIDPAVLEQIKKVDWPTHAGIYNPD
jgi:hypothetical protein